MGLLIQLDKRVQNRFKARIERYDLNVGVLEDKPYRLPKPMSKGHKSRAYRKANVEAERSRRQIEADRIFERAGIEPEKTGKKRKPRSAKAKLKSWFKKKLKAKPKKKVTRDTPAVRRAKREKAKAEMVAFNRSVGLGTLEGGPVRKKQAKTKGKISDVSRYFRYRTNYLQAPFNKPNSGPMKKFRKLMWELITGQEKSYGRAQAALRDVVRRPILKQQYGRNKPYTIKAKGFNRLGFDTGQLYQNIKARIRVSPGMKKGK